MLLAGLRSLSERKPTTTRDGRSAVLSLAREEHALLRLFKTDPAAKLEKQYARKLEQARDAQRGGKIPEFADLSAEAEAIGKQLDELRQGSQ